MENLITASGRPDIITSLISLPRLLAKCSPLEKSKIYLDITLELLTHCQNTSSNEHLGVQDEIERIEDHFERLLNTTHSYEQAKKSWNPQKILKRRRQHIKLATQSFDLLEVTKTTSDRILRKACISAIDQRSLISTTASFLTAIDNATQNDMDDKEDEINADGDALASSADEDQSEEQVVAQVQGFTRAIQEMPISQATNFTFNQNIFCQSVVHQGSGSSTNSSVIAGGSNNRGGGSQYTTSSSRRST